MICPNCNHTFREYKRIDKDEFEQWLIGEIGSAPSLPATRLTYRAVKRFGIARTNVWCALRRLQKDNVIVKSGVTSATRYALNKEA